MSVSLPRPPELLFPLPAAEMLALALSMLAWDENDVARIMSTYKPLRHYVASWPPNCR